MMACRRLAIMAVAFAGNALAAPNHPRHVANGSHTNSHQVLDQAKVARAELLRRQAGQAALIQARQRAQTLAQARAAADATRTRTLAAQTRDASAQLDATDAQIGALQNDIATLTAQQVALKATIDRHTAALSALLPLAVRMSAAPNTSLIAVPTPPAQAIEGLSILAGLSTLTEHAAERLRDEQAKLTQTNAALQARNQNLRDLHQTQAIQRDAVARQTRVAAQVERRADDAATQARAAVAAATTQASDLQDAITRIEKVEADAQAALDAEARALQQRHQLAQARHVRAQAAAMSTASGPGPSHGNGNGPVAGHIAVAWGQTTEAGPATGITYDTAGAAPVAAPCAGRVDFAGPFRSFGQMLILDCGRRYRFVLAGLGSLSARSGQSISRGAALGTMPSSGGHLFLQLRQGSQSVDPRPFL